jgi:hypothetical protein
MTGVIYWKFGGLNVWSVGPLARTLVSLTQSVPSRWLNECCISSQTSHDNAEKEARLKWRLCSNLNASLGTRDIDHYDSEVACICIYEHLWKTISQQHPSLSHYTRHKRGYIGFCSSVQSSNFRMVLQRTSHAVVSSCRHRKDTFLDQLAWIRHACSWCIWEACVSSYCHVVNQHSNSPFPRSWFSCKLYSMHVSVDRQTDRQTVLIWMHLGPLPVHV